MKKYFILLLAGFLFFIPNISAQTYSTLLDENFMKSVTVDELRQLIQNGENPYITNQKGETPLHIAAKVNENPEVIKTLLEYGFNANIKDNEGHTPLQNVVLSTFLVNSDEIIKEKNEIVNLLIRYGANVNARDINGNTPLHFVSVPEITETLIRHGANINVKNIAGCTPLHLAARLSGNLELIELLIKHGADVNIQNNLGETALIGVTQNLIHLIGCSGGVAKIEPQIPQAIELLIKNGADVKLRDKSGKTVLDYYTSDPNFKKHPGYWKTLDLLYNKMNEE
jgi:ankyrin repeat protein